MLAGELERYAADVFRRFGVPFNPDAGIVKYWLGELRRGRFLGFPMEPEHRTEDGRWVVQGFSSTILSMGPEGVVREGLPPFA